MDGVLVIDKPEGMTSHDVVAIARRALGERRIGHTGTLDPMATGVLPLACGRATRLVRFLTASDKTYDATIRFGLVTDTYDVTGRPLQTSADRPTEQDVRAALAAMTGEQMQVPPPYSAKKVAGRRAYDLARQDLPVALAPVRVHVAALDLLEWAPDRVVIQVTASAGYYVRSLAHDLGARLGMGACLEALRRTQSGNFGLSGAVTVATLRDGGALQALLPLHSLLPDWEAVEVAAPGRARLSHGQSLRAADVVRHVPGHSPGWARVVDHDTRALIGLATTGHPDGALHPDIVLI